MKSTLLRCESWQGLFLHHMSILMLTMTLRNLFTAILAKKMLHMRKQIPRKTTNEIRSLLGFQINTLNVADVCLSMAHLMHKAIKKFFRRGRLAHYHYSDTIPPACIGQPCILYTSTKIAESQTHCVHIRTY